jgi:hypothetical protein
VPLPSPGRRFDLARHFIRSDTCLQSRWSFYELDIVTFVPGSSNIHFAVIALTCRVIEEFDHDHFQRVLLQTFKRR